MEQLNKVIEEKYAEIEKKYTHYKENKKTNIVVLYSIVSIYIRFFKKTDTVDNIIKKFNITGHDISITFIKTILNNISDNLTADVALNAAKAAYREARREDKRNVASSAEESARCAGDEFVEVAANDANAAAINAGCKFIEAAFVEVAATAKAQLDNRIDEPVFADEYNKIVEKHDFIIPPNITIQEKILLKLILAFVFYNRVIV